MLNDAAIFLGRAGQEAWHIDQGHDRNVKGIAEAHETTRLDGTGNVQTARQNHRLIGNDADRVPFDPRKANYDVACIVGLDFKEIFLVRNLMDQFLDIIRLVGIGRDQCVQRHVQPVMGIVGRAVGRLFLIIQRQETQEAAQLQQCLHIIFKGQVGNARFAGMACRAP